MRLHEYQSKLLFSNHNIPVPKGRLASTPGEAKQVAIEIGLPVVLKAQVLSGGRGKAGGIRLVKTLAEVEVEASRILSSRFKNYSVSKLLVEQAAEIRQEIYLGITIDRSLGQPVVIVCADGGVDIEIIATNSPERIIKKTINPLIGLREYQVREILAEIDMPKEYWRAFNQIAISLWNIFNQYDATLVEINPLVITKDGFFVSVDAKLTIDDNALIRHREFLEMRDLSVESQEESEARKFCLSYIRLNGNIGCLVNGAGLAMATMDSIQKCGGEPANFLDIGGGANAEKVAAALKIIISDPQVKSILINIFGGITRCDEVAKGLLNAITDTQINIPLIIRLVGTNAEIGKQLLLEQKQITANSLLEAAQLAVENAKGD